MRPHSRARSHTVLYHTYYRHTAMAPQVPAGISLLSQFNRSTHPTQPGLCAVGHEAQQAARAESSSGTTNEHINN